VKVRVDSRQNNKKATVLQFKMGDLVKFRQISSKINNFATRVGFRHFVSFSLETKSFGAKG